MVVLPSNEGRGYVLEKNYEKRALRHVQKPKDSKESQLCGKLVSTIDTNEMGEAFLPRTRKRARIVNYRNQL